MRVLEVEFLTGVVVASRSDDAGSLDWPPQPDRVFSALVATWGARGSRADERTALEWLEEQESPRIIACDAGQRSSPVVYVPPNDFKTSVANLDVMPGMRRRQARRFPAARLAERTVRFVWSERTSPPPEIDAALDVLARDTAYVGHSLSLTRCRFTDEDVDMASSRSAVRTVYPGRLAELVRDFERGRRPSPGNAATSSRAAAVASVPDTIFGNRWIVLVGSSAPHLGGSSVVPDIRATGVVTRKLRDTLMTGFPDCAAPEWLSGHRSDGPPSIHPHVAVVPLANVGWEHSQGDLMGLAIVPPRDLPEEDEQALRAAVRAKLHNGSHPVLELGYGGPGPWFLVPTDSPERSSLQPRRWLARDFGATIWASATPIVLDRFPKERGIARDAEISEIVGRACRDIGLPQPAHVVASSVSAVPGSPPAFVARNRPAWERWQLPRSLCGRMLTHVLIGFDRPVRGPVIIGAGRFVGLGLCLPVKRGVQE